MRAHPHDGAQHRRRFGRRLAAALGALALLLGACGSGGADEPAIEEADAVDDAAPTTTTVASTTAPACATIPVEQRAGMTLVVGLPGVTSADDPLVDRLVAVGVSGVSLRDENLVSREQATALISGLRARLGEHLLVGVDEEGGRVTSLGAIGGRTPSARSLGRAGAGAATAAGAELAGLLSSLGFDWIFAPVLDLDGGPANEVIGDRSFSADPVVTIEVASAFAAELRNAGIAVTAKHFPGHGGPGDPHHGIIADPSPLEELAATDLVPFQQLVDRGVETVMVGHVAYPQIWGDRPASLEPGAYELLRSTGFDGVAVTDAIGMGAVYSIWGFDTAPPMALAAGADAILVNQGDRLEELRDGIVAAVGRGELSEERLDEAVTRVLRLQGRDPAAVLCAGG